jgi:hypothetical protein
VVFGVRTRRACLLWIPQPARPNDAQQPPFKGTPSTFRRCRFRGPQERLNYLVVVLNPLACFARLEMLDDLPGFLILLRRPLLHHLPSDFITRAFHRSPVIGVCMSSVGFAAKKLHIVSLAQDSPTAARCFACGPTCCSPLLTMIKDAKRRVGFQYFHLFFLSDRDSRIACFHTDGRQFSMPYSLAFHPLFER